MWQVKEARQIRETISSKKVLIAVEISAIVMWWVEKDEGSEKWRWGTLKSLISVEGGLQTHVNSVYRMSYFSPISERKYRESHLSQPADRRALVGQ